MVVYMDITNWVLNSVFRVPLFMLVLAAGIQHTSQAAGVGLDIVGTLNTIQKLLMQIGPILSTVLFITAGIFYALGQLLPSYKRASLHTMAIDIIIGAIIVAVLSVASTGLAVTSAHLLSNSTPNLTTG
jgi:riboflavin transporter FmnP